MLEFIDRLGCPLFHLEHYIDGHYIKYNSNSGFVEQSLRLTPQVVILHTTTTHNSSLMGSIPGQPNYSQL